MKHEAITELTGKSINDLFITACTQRCHNQCLCFATREKGRTVRTR